MTQFSDTSYVFYTLIQFLIHLLGDNIRSHQTVRAHMHTDTYTFSHPLPSDASQSPSCICASDQPAIDQKFQKGPSLSLIILPEWLTELKETVFLPDY